MDVANNVHKKREGRRKEINCANVIKLTKNKYQWLRPQGENLSKRVKGVHRQTKKYIKGSTRGTIRNQRKQYSITTPDRNTMPGGDQ